MLNKIFYYFPVEIIQGPFLKWSISLDGGSKDATYAKEDVNRLLTIHRVIGATHGLSGFFNTTLINDRWLTTPFAPKKAKSKQKAIRSLKRFANFVIQKHEECSFGSQCSMQKATSAESTYARWGEALNDKIGKETAATVANNRKTLIDKDTMIKCYVESQHVAKVEQMLQAIMSKLFHITELSLYCLASWDFFFQFYK